MLLSFTFHLELSAHQVTVETNQLTVLQVLGWNICAVTASFIAILNPAIFSATNLTTAGNTRNFARNGQLPCSLYYSITCHSNSCFVVHVGGELYVVRNTNLIWVFLNIYGHAIIVYRMVTNTCCFVVWSAFGSAASPFQLPFSILVVCYTLYLFTMWCISLQTRAVKLISLTVNTWRN